jgi:hypothetical protein
VSLIESLLIVIVWQTRTQKGITTFLERKKKGNRNKTQTNKKKSEKQEKSLGLRTKTFAGFHQCILIQSLFVQTNNQKSYLTDTPYLLSSTSNCT